MEHPIVKTLKEQTDGLAAEQLLAVALEQFGRRIALASSLSAEDQVIVDMLTKLRPNPDVFTLDTGRLPEETYDVIEATHSRYGVRIEILFPDRQAVEEMIRQSGPNLFRSSVEARKRCCLVRKVEPLRRRLKTLDAWITGLRRSQSVTRGQLQRIEWDESNGLVKINPLADWTAEQVWAYIDEHDTPVNALHAGGYPSIGCAPCTRAIGPGEDERAGRWWWEQPEQKECGLHVVDGHLARTRR